MGSRAKSLGYFLRNWSARLLGAYRKNVTVYACLTQFQKNRLIMEGFPAERIRVIPNMIPTVPTEISEGKYIGFAGRLNHEKGIKTLIECAKQTPEIPYKAAGSGSNLSELAAEVPANFQFLGQLRPEQMKDFYRNCRFLVLPSEWFEGLPMVLLEAMAHGKPLIASQLGGIPEIVEEGKTGLLFEPGKSKKLAEKIKALWENPDACRSMGQAGRQKARKEYSYQRHYERLSQVYEEAISLGSGGIRIRAKENTNKRKIIQSITEENWAHSSKSISPNAILGVRFNLTNADQAVQMVLQWRQQGRKEMVMFAPPHSVLIARRDQRMRAALAKAALVLPDGAGIILAAKILGYNHLGRVTGPNFMLELCDKGRQADLKHYFYGGAPGVAKKLIDVLSNKYPGLHVAGHFCPPFRELTASEDKQVIQTINHAQPDVLWIGLGAPKQEKWMLDHFETIQATAMLGVGAAFDFHSGQVKWAPPLVRSLGLEWAWRLGHQPRRMVKRNLDSPRFIYHVLQQRISARNIS